MQTYEIIVSGRAVHANSADTTLVRTSIGIDKIHVLFDNEEWTSFPVRVTFANGDTIISTSLTLAEIDAPEWAAEAECAIPWEVIQDLGGIRITFQGTDASGNHIITEASGEPLSVVEAGDVGSGTVPSPAPSVDEWNQAYANAMAAANSASGAAESATEAADRANTAAADAEQVLEDGIPLMDDDTRGGAKLGDGLEVDENEALNAKVGGDISIDGNGAISYELPVMSETQHGGATLGSGLTVDDGALSLGDLVQSGSGAEVATDGCAIFSVDGEGWAEQNTTTGKNLLDAIGKRNTTDTTLQGETLVNAVVDSRNQLQLYIQFYNGSTYVSNAGILGNIIGLRSAVVTTPSAFTRVVVKHSGSARDIVFVDDNTVSSRLSAGQQYIISLYVDSNDSSTVGGAKIRDIQLEAGSTATAYEPYTGGLPSPSPDYPQEIEVCRGRNLLPQDSESSYSTPGWTIGGSSTGVYVGLEAGQYAISADCITAESGKKLEFGFFDANNNNVGGASVSMAAVGRPYATVTLTAKAVRVRAYLDGGACKNIQLELGTTPTPYVPYGHVGLERDLYPSSKTIANKGASATGGYADSTASNIIEVVAGAGTYSLVYDYQSLSSTNTRNACFYRADGIFISNQYLTPASKLTEIVAPSGTGKIAITVDNGVTDIKLLMPTTPIPLPSKGWAGGLPDGTADALTVDSAGRWEWVNESDEVVFDGSSDEGWELQNGGKRVSANGTSSYASPVKLSSSSSVINAMCSHFRPVSVNTTWGGTLGVAGNSGYITGTSFAPLNFSDGTGAMTVANWTTWLASNPVTVLYPLATPTTEHGYIDLPALPSGATVSIPELESIGVSWFVEGCEPIVEHISNERRRTEDALSDVYEAIADL